MKFNRKGIYIAFPSILDRFLFTSRRVNYGSKKYGSWTITFWDDFKANTENTETLETFAINGANIDPR